MIRMDRRNWVEQEVSMRPHCVLRTTHRNLRPRTPRRLQRARSSRPCRLTCACAGSPPPRTQSRAHRPRSPIPAKRRDAFARARRGSEGAAGSRWPRSHRTCAVRACRDFASENGPQAGALSLRGSSARRAAAPADAQMRQTWAAPARARGSRAPWRRPMRRPFPRSCAGTL
jgi:hypothetical protein